MEDPRSISSRPDTCRTSPEIKESSLKRLEVLLLFLPFRMIAIFLLEMNSSNVLDETHFCCC